MFMKQKYNICILYHYLGRGKAIFERPNAAREGRVGLRLGQRKPFERERHARVPLRRSDVRDMRRRRVGGRKKRQPIAPRSSFLRRNRRDNPYLYGNLAGVAFNPRAKQPVEPRVPRRHPRFTGAKPLQTQHDRRVAGRFKECIEEEIVAESRRACSSGGGFPGADPCGINSGRRVRPRTTPRPRRRESGPAPREGKRLAGRANVAAAMPAQPGDFPHMRRIRMPGDEAFGGADPARTGARLNPAALAGARRKKRPAFAVDVDVGEGVAQAGPMRGGCGIEGRAFGVPWRRGGLVRTESGAAIARTRRADGAARTTLFAGPMARGAAGGALSAHPSRFS